MKIGPISVDFYEKTPVKKGEWKYFPLYNIGGILLFISLVI